MPHRKLMPSPICVFFEFCRNAEQLIRFPRSLWRKVIRMVKSASSSPTMAEKEPMPEEIEEMQKKEAKKDKLHQNYLKRKADGKQKEYEERTKAAKYRRQGI